VITIVGTLRPSGVELDLQTDNLPEAVYQVALLLQRNPHVLDWDKLYNGLQGGDVCMPAGDDFEICIPHARTNCVSTMVMSVGRSRVGIAVPGSKNKVHYIFVVGVPVAMASNYLRIIGALSRTLKDPQAEKELRTAKTGEEFVAILTSRELAA
jgi:mannitol/fructose-specific phosphotransferase system IIA component (Ntr-type)